MGGSHDALGGHGALTRGGAAQRRVRQRAVAVHGQRGAGAGTRAGAERAVHPGLEAEARTRRGAEGSLWHFGP